MDFPHGGQWRSLINQVLAEENNSKKIEEVLRSISSAERRPTSKEDALILLRSKGIIDSILRVILPDVPHSIQSVESVSNGHGTPGLVDSVQIESPRTSLFPVGLAIEIIRGTAFIEHIVSYTDYVKGEKGNIDSSLTIHLSFGSHRFCTTPKPFNTEVDFHEQLLLPLITDTHEKQPIGPHQILHTYSTASHLLRIVLVSKELSTGHTELVASTALDWRRYLFHGTDSKLSSVQPWTVSFPLELKSVDPDSKMTAGILDLQISLVWNLPHKNIPSSQEPSASAKPNETPLPLPPQVVDVQFALEAARASQREHAFTLYVRRWWQELTQLREGCISKRLIKLFAVDENSVTQFVCNFVHPLRAGQQFLSTPTMAARFVSTIPCEPCRGVGGGQREQWCSILAFLARNRGDVSDHANLLCSLLLGFGLDAYVAIGTQQLCGTDTNNLIKTSSDVENSASNKPYAWVAVFHVDSSVVLFWDAVSGRRHVQPLDRGISQNGGTRYKTIDCLYNHCSFYANIQPTNELSTCSLCISDSSLWCPLSSDMISSVTPYSNLVPGALVNSRLNTFNLSTHLEQELRALATNWRTARLHQDPPNTWTWDEELSHLLSPVLAGFEADQVHSCMTIESHESSRTYQLESRLNMAALHQYVPEGYTFKAYPIQVLHTNARRILQVSVRSRLCRDILTCRGASVRLGLCVRIYSYAEEATATWVMFACIYKSTF